MRWAQRRGPPITDKIKESKSPSSSTSSLSPSSDDKLQAANDDEVDDAADHHHRHENANIPHWHFTCSNQFLCVTFRVFSPTSLRGVVFRWTPPFDWSWSVWSAVVNTWYTRLMYSPHDFLRGGNGASGPRKDEAGAARPAVDKNTYNSSTLLIIIERTS